MADSQANDTPADRVLAPLPGWLFMLAGLALIAAAVLVPPWLATQHLEWRHSVMAAREATMDRQQQRYAQFHAALKRRDPLLLERLAREQLRLEPADSSRPSTAAGPESGTAIPGGGEGPDDRAARGVGPRTPMIPITDWLAEPMPRVGQELAAYEPTNTRLTRLATGRSRWALLGAGLLCAVGGLLARAGQQPSA